MRRNISHTPKAYSLALDSKINQFRSSIKNKTPEIDKKYDLKIKVESFRVLHYANVYKFTAIDQLMDILHRLRFKIFRSNIPSPSPPPGRTSTMLPEERPKLT